MGANRNGKATWIVTLVFLGHLAGVLIASACLWWLGNWERYHSGLTLTLRILWGVLTVHLLATILTRVTIFGWNFRRYFRPTEATKPPPPPLRATTAPWYKSGKVSFSITVVLVSLTGACAIAIAVMYILRGVVGDWVFWLVFKIIGASYWVLCVAIVVTRVAIFSAEKKAANAAGAEAEAEKPEATPTVRASPVDVNKASLGESSEGGS
jgi:hypothetical protein